MRKLGHWRYAEGMKSMALVLAGLIGLSLVGCGGEDDASSPSGMTPSQLTDGHTVPMDGDAVVPPLCPANVSGYACDASTKRPIGTHSTEYWICWTNASRATRQGSCTIIDSMPSPADASYTSSAFCVDECPAPLPR